MSNHPTPVKKWSQADQFVDVKQTLELRKERKREAKERQMMFEEDQATFANDLLSFSPDIKNPTQEELQDDFLEEALHTMRRPAKKQKLPDVPSFLPRGPPPPPPGSAFNWI